MRSLALSPSSRFSGADVCTYICRTPSRGEWTRPRGNNSFAYDVSHYVVGPFLRLISARRSFPHWAGARLFGADCNSVPYAQLLFSLLGRYAQHPGGTQREAV